MPIGFVNLGNTCFFNAALQFLCCVIGANAPRATDGGKTALQAELWRGVHMVCRISGTVKRGDMRLSRCLHEKLFSTFVQSAKFIKRRGTQEDAHESLLCFLECIPLAVMDTLRIDTNTCIREAPGRGTGSITSWSSRYLTVHVPPRPRNGVVTAAMPRLSQLIRGLFQEEHIRKGLYKTMTIRRLHGWLIVLVGRYRSNNWRSRTNDAITIDSTLTLATSLCQDVRFTLTAVVHHLGTKPGSGHYVTDILHGSSWVRCDDARIVRSAGGPGERPSTTAYICAYKRVV